MLKILLFSIIGILSLNCSFAQVGRAEKDSLHEVKIAERAEKFADLDPSKAALLSTILPGAGQFYNKSYWKIPIVYAGLGTFTALAIYNHNEYIRYKRALNNKTDGDETTVVEPDLERLTENGLKANRNQSKKYRDLNIIMGVLFYGLNIVDAYVDGHLKGFNVTDDISMHVEPSIYMDGNNLAGGLTLNFRLK